ncbi:MAG: tol-pal system protein YbgF [Pseudomonadota bacterium]
MLRSLSVIVLLALSGPAAAQDSSLADIRQELGVLNAEIARLKSELNTTGTASGAAVTGDTLQRIDAIEAGLTRLNAKTEQLENRINRVVTDGTNRIGDLEFRLVELEGGDLSTVGQTPTLGGDVGAAPAAQAAIPQNDAPELAIGEKNDFERAEGALASGDFRSAAEQFATFTQSYPGSPLEADAHYLRGEALQQAGDSQGAARAFLESFSGFPGSTRAPSALYKLGLALDALGQRNEACLMLTEVGNRYPASDQVSLANQSRASLGCS